MALMSWYELGIRASSQTLGTYDLLVKGLSTHSCSSSLVSDEALHSDANIGEIHDYCVFQYYYFANV